jgi:hypothetical protein
VSNGKDLNAMLRLFERQGCAVTRRRNGHWKVIAPDGTPVYMSATPSDVRAIRKIKAFMRRHGTDI